MVVGGNIWGIGEYEVCMGGVIEVFNICVFRYFFFILVIIVCFCLNVLIFVFIIGFCLLFIKWVFVI